MQKATDKERTFEMLYKQHYTTLFYRALDWTLDEDVAKDMVEDLFVDLWQKLDSVRLNEVVGLLHTALRNRAINYHRHKAVERKYEDECLAVTTELMDEPDELHEERLRVLENAFNEQPKQRRFVFEQCCMEGKSYKEVSEIVGVEVSTVHKHVSRMYAELRKIFNVKNSGKR